MRREPEPKRIGINVLTHNTLFGQSVTELPGIIEQEKISVFCGQEMGRNMPGRIGKLEKAAHVVFDSKNGKVGLATYYDPDQLDVVSISSHQLTPARVTEYLRVNPSGDRLLVVTFIPKGERGKRRKHQKRVALGNGHDSNMAASKNLRFRQLVAAGETTRDVAHNSSGALFMDTNLPYLTDEELRDFEEQTGLRYVGPLENEATYKNYPPIFEQLSNPDRKTFDRGFVTEDLAEGVEYTVLSDYPTPSDHIPVKFSI